MAKRTKRVKMTRLFGYFNDDRPLLENGCRDESVPDGDTVVGMVPVPPFNLDTQENDGYHTGIGKTNTGEYYVCVASDHCDEDDEDKYCAHLVSDATAEARVLRAIPQDYDMIFGEEQPRAETKPVSNPGIVPANIAGMTIDDVPPAEAMFGLLNKAGWQFFGNGHWLRPYGDDAIFVGLCIHDDSAGIVRFHVKPEHRGLGIASVALAELTAIADRIGFVLKLEACPTHKGGLTLRQLIRWYGLHGFVNDEVMGMDQGQFMVRVPR